MAQTPKSRTAVVTKTAKVIDIVYEKGKRPKDAVVNASELFEDQVKNIFNDKETGDVVIHCGKKKFYCHSMVLKQHSPVFIKLLKDIKPGMTVELDTAKDFPADLEPKYLVSVLKYMYKGQLRGPKKNSEIGMLKVASVLGMTEIKNVILAYMGTYFTPQDACTIIASALEKKQFHLFEICAKIIEGNDEVVFSEGNNLLMTWPYEILQHFVKVGNISVEEGQLFKIVERYVRQNFKRYDYTHPKDFFLEHFEEFMRYPMMKPEDLATNVASSGWVDPKYLFEAYRFISVSDTIKDKLKQDSLRYKTRQTYSKHKWTLSSGGNMLTLTNGDRTVEKTSGSSGWNSMCYIEIKGKGKISYKVNVDHTNSDRSGLSIGFFGSNVKSSPGSYGQAVGTQYYKPSSSSVGNPPNGAKLEYICDTKNDYFEIIHNGKSLGRCTRKPSQLQKPLYFGVFLYYLKNKVTIVRK